MKLWDKGYSTDDIVEKFTIGSDREFDIYLAKYDVEASIAHAKMLSEIGILTKIEMKGIVSELQNIKKEVIKSNFQIPKNFEDIHSYIEYLLTKKLGETGKKIHTGRSRNDQVLVDIHLYFKDEIKNIIDLTTELFDSLLELSTKHKEKLLPGYTHLQVAMPSSFGLWFAAYAELLIDDIYLFISALKIANQNPLGSAAGYGTSFKLDRELTTKLLNFEEMKYNVVAAQMSRGKLEKTFGFAIASIAGTLSKFAMDVCLYMSQNFSFIGFPDNLTTGSSIMPHKKNPDVFELIRAKCNKLQSIPNEVTLIVNNLTSGYHRDFQILKETFFPSIETIKACLSVTKFMIKHIIIKEIDLNDEKYKYMFSVEAVNKEVEKGTSFREAYLKIGKEIEKGNFKPTLDIKHTHCGSIGNLCNNEIRNKMKKALSYTKL